MPPKSSNKKTSGLMLHASTVALSPARALTSHVRRRYHERYRGRYRFAPFIFGFDLFLLGVLAALLIVDVAWLLQASFISQSGIALSFTAPPIRGSDILPVEARVQAIDGRVHEDVVLRWNLPDWVEVIQANPPVRKDGTLLLGEVRPGDERDSHLLVRIRAPKGTSVPFAFTLQQFDPLGLHRSLVGSESRVVESSALVLKPVVPETLLVSGASIPFLVRNRSSAPAKAVSVRLTKENGAPNAGFDGRDAVSIGELAPSEERIVFLDVGETSARQVDVTVEVDDGAQAVGTQDLSFSFQPETAVSAEIFGMKSRKGQAAFSWRHATRSTQMLVFHPFLKATNGDRFVSFRVNPGDGQSTLDVEGPAQSGSWSVIPQENGVLGKRVTASITKSLSFAAAARYYSTTGDQVGIGPNPPKAGQKTTYWIVWTVGPMDATLRDMTLSADLPDGVATTGKFASPSNGTFSADGQHVTWTIPSLTLAGAETETFAFEVSFTPTRIMAGTTHIIVGSSSAQAIDTKTGASLEATAPADDTRLMHDERASSTGMIVR